ncbi:MAG: periplasmic heavy metal sensor [Alphaproteobacteria bacterium]|nr:periplasmic heavy metal sensor [Alphaproteobacteria bacterium]
MRGSFPIWVYVSLGLNILLLGFVLGGVLLRPSFPMPMMAMKGMLEHIPEHGRALIKEAFTDLRKTHEDMEAELKSARQSLADAVAAPQLDLSTLDKAEERMRSNAETMIKKGSVRMRELLQKLTPEERVIIADHLRTAPPEMPPMP